MARITIVRKQPLSDGMNDIQPELPNFGLLTANGTAPISKERIHGVEDRCVGLVSLLAGKTN